jgi:hypothetical protein
MVQQVMDRSKGGPPSYIRTAFCGKFNAVLEMLYGTLYLVFIHGWLKGSSAGPVGYNSRLASRDSRGEIDQQWLKVIGMLMRLGTIVLNWDDFSPPLVLRELLLGFRGREMTDKRDAVYAVLPLAGDISTSDWNFDYGISHIDVFKVVVRKEIESSKSLDILCNGPSSCLHGYLLPSWVPRFDNQEFPCGCPSFLGSALTFRGTRLVIENDPVTTSPHWASKSRRPSALIFGQDNKLAAEALFIDHIKLVMQRPVWASDPTEEAELTIPKQWFTVAFGPIKSEDSEKNPHIQKNLDHSELDPQKFEALWRTMIADRVSWWSGPAPAHIGEGFKKWLLQHKDCNLVVPTVEILDSTGPSAYLDFYREFKNSLRGAIRSEQTLVITKWGSLGLAKGAIIPDYRVCILLGCSVPMIIRRVPDSEREEYILIGEGYIHGMMDGEAIDKLDKGEYEVKKITII